jgi:hypothetical protein
MIKIRHFRPSSHSEDGTIVATFKNKEEARKAAKKLSDEAPGSDDFSCSLSENRLILYLCDAEYGTMGTITERLEDFAEDIREYNQYQELTIEVCLPNKSTLAHLPLVLDRDSLEIVLWLLKTGKPETRQSKDSYTMVFSYCGEGIYESQENSFSEKEVLIINNREREIGPNITVSPKL